MKPKRYSFQIHDREIFARSKTHGALCREALALIDRRFTIRDFSRRHPRKFSLLVGRQAFPGAKEVKIESGMAWIGQTWFCVLRSTRQALIEEIGLEETGVFNPRGVIYVKVIFHRREKS